MTTIVAITKMVMANKMEKGGRRDRSNMCGRQAMAF